MQSSVAPVATVAPRGLVILGHPITQSLSPVFQSAALAHCGLSLRYERWDTPPDQLDAALARCAAAGLGGNATVPLKELVAARAHRLSDVAAQCGAVNTFWFEGDALVGHNTDVDGALATLGALIPTGSLGHVVLLGAGGSAAAVLVALARRGCTRLSVIARTPARATALLARLQMEGTALEPGSPAAQRALREATLVINSSPVGMRDDAMPVEPDAFSDHAALYDLVFRPAGTAWVRAARARGLRAEDGLRMLVEQGAAAFRCWFGIDAPREVMWRALGAEVPLAQAPRA